MAAPMSVLPLEADTVALWDFGNRQYLSNAFTGEVRCVYGSGAIIDGGPFRLELDEGKALIVGQGSDEDWGGVGCAAWACASIVVQVMAK